MLNACGNCLEVIGNSPGTEFELIWKTHGNIYNIDYNLSVTQVELFINEGIIFGQIDIFLLKKEISYSTHKENNQSCQNLISTFH
jgi:NAD-dependent DNA ligase